jgi:hypothetical protein
MYRFGSQNEGTIVVANTRHLRESAFRLIYDVYRSKGYDMRVGGESGLWCTIHSLHPDTVIFLAEISGRPVGSVSVIPDSRLGLPVDLIFPDPLSPLRKAGRRLCEVSSLVVIDGTENGALGLPLHLYRLAHFASADLLKATDIVVSFMAHHAKFYSRFLFFDDISPESKLSPKTGQQVRYGRLNLETMKARYKKKYGHLSGRRNLFRWFFMDDNKKKELLDWLQRDRRPMTLDDLQYFGADKSDILSRAGEDAAAALRDYYGKTRGKGSGNKKDCVAVP